MIYQPINQDFFELPLYNLAESMLFLTAANPTPS